MNVQMKTQQLTGVAILAAIVVVLQAFATAVNFVTPGTIPIALVLPPIIIGAVMYGTRAGALLGFCFGMVVLISGIFGLAPTSAFMWSVSPPIMTVGTLGRGIAIGVTAGLVHKAFAKKSTYLGVISAAIAVPLVNTGIFALVFFLFYEILVPEGAGHSFLHYAIAFIIGINFLIELIFNIVLAPTIVRIIGVVKKRRY